MKPNEFMAIVAMCEAQKTKPVGKAKPPVDPYPTLPDWVVCERSHQAWLNGAMYYLQPSGIHIDAEYDGGGRHGN